MDRNKLRESLIEKWNAFSDQLCSSDYFFEEFITYEECLKLIKKTKKYFDDLPVKGTLGEEDCALYESAGVLRYLSLYYEPADHKEEFDKACKEVINMFDSLESIAK